MPPGIKVKILQDCVLLDPYDRATGSLVSGDITIIKSGWYFAEVQKSGLVEAMGYEAPADLLESLDRLQESLEPSDFKTPSGEGNPHAVTGDTIPLSQEDAALANSIVQNTKAGETGGDLPGRIPEDQARRGRRSKG